MGYYGTYGEISNRFKDWIQANTEGGNVEDLAMDILNRAQQDLSGNYLWSNQMKDEDLTLVSGKIYSLPAGYLALAMIGWDSSGDGRFDGYYWRHGQPDDGYNITDSFTLADGHSYRITFYIDVSQKPRIRYQYELEDFAGDDDDEVSFYPAELLLRTAQRIRIEDEGMSGNEVTVILNAEAKALKDYKQKFQWVNPKMRNVLRDSLGAVIRLPDVNTAGVKTNPNYRGGYKRSFDG